MTVEIPVVPNPCAFEALIVESGEIRRIVLVLIPVIPLYLFKSIQMAAFGLVDVGPALAAARDAG